MIFLFLTRFFGHGRRIRKLRKRWDRQREKTLKINEPLKSQILKKLDQIELNIRTLEERRLNRVELARIEKEVEIDLEETRAVLRTKETYTSQIQQSVQH